MAVTSSAPSNRLLRTVAMTWSTSSRAVVDGRRPGHRGAAWRATSSSRSLQPVRDGVAVFAHQHEAEAQHDFALAVGGDGTAAQLVADGDVGHVADANRHALVGGDDDVFDLLDGRRAADALHEQHLAGLVFVDVAAADVEVVLREPPATTSSNETSCRSSCSGIDAHLVLLFQARPRS